MRPSVAFVLAMALVLCGGNAIAAPPAHSPAGRAIVRVADAGPIADAGPAAGTVHFVAGHDAYLQRARNLFQLWRVRMNDWGERAQITGGKIGRQARKNLDKSWSNLKSGWERLETAEAHGWHSARAAFDKASARMRTAWQELHPKR